MRVAYRVLAYLLALEVVVQAAAIAWAVFGLSTWIEDGGVLDKAGMESDSTVFDGVLGFAIHGINGQMIVPAIALVREPQLPQSQLLPSPRSQPCPTASHR